MSELTTDKSFHLSIVSPERQIYAGEVRMVTAVSVDGELGIMPDLIPGEVKIVTMAGEEEYVYVSGGYIEILPTQVTILADTALRGQDVDEAAATEAKRLAEKTISTSPLYSDRDQAQVELIKALAQLRALEHSRRRKKRGM